MEKIRENIIENALVCAVTFYDEKSKISPSLSARVHVVFKRIAELLIKECSLFDKDFLHILDDHKDIAFYNEILRIIQDSISEKGIELLNNELMFLAEFGRILPYRGMYYHTLPDKNTCKNEIEFLLKSNDETEPNKCSEHKIAVILSFRIDCEERFRNLLASLYSIRTQDIGRENIYIVAVNQDNEDNYRDMLGKYVDEYVFVHNANTYNYAWGRNVGANRVKDADIYVFWDIDIIAEKNMLSDIYSAFADERIQSVVPYCSAYNLDDISTSAALGSMTKGRIGEIAENSYSQVMHEVYGMLISTRTKMFYEIGGQDERYEGWGDEDNDFYQRLYLNGEIRRLKKNIFHLDHSRPVMRINGEKINRQFVGDLKTSEADIGDLNKYSDN